MTAPWVAELSAELTPLVMQAARLVELTGRRRDVGIVALAHARPAVLILSRASVPACLAGPLDAILAAAADVGGLAVLVVGGDDQVAGLVLGELETRAGGAAA